MTSNASRFVSNGVTHLKVLIAQSDPKQTSYFNGLLPNASGYAGMHSNVDGSSSKATNALYQYKTEKFCADVEHELMSALSSSVVVS